MDFSVYQQAAKETSQLRLGGPQAAVAPMLGLASETGSILNVYKRYLRDGISLSGNRELLAEELGDLLWYVAAVATACDLDLNDIATANLARTRDRYRSTPSTDEIKDLPVFDASYPLTERFPRRLVVEFSESLEPPDRVIAQMTLTSAEPNVFTTGPVQRNGGVAGFQVGGYLGDPLSDNSRQADDYRYHDAIHFGFMAVLGWSPNLRSLLHLKRKSDRQTDECEDGARAIFAEEGLAAILARLAKHRMGFVTETCVDGDVIEVARAAAAGLEVEVLPAWLWRRAVCQGFSVLRQLAEHKGGYVIADLDERRLSHEKVLR